MWGRERGVWGRERGVWSRERGVWDRERGVWGRERGVSVAHGRFDSAVAAHHEVALDGLDEGEGVYLHGTTLPWLQVTAARVTLQYTLQGPRSIFDSRYFLHPS